MLISAERNGIIMLAGSAMRLALHVDKPAPEKRQRRKRAKAFKIVR